MKGPGAGNSKASVSGLHLADNVGNPVMGAAGTAAEVTGKVRDALGYTDSKIVGG